MTTKLIGTCPSCAHELVATRLGCSACGIALEGEFALPPLLRLAPDDLAFVTEFVSVSGSLKEMAQRRQLSYPTIRNRLDAIIAQLAAADAAPNPDTRRHDILDQVAKGALSAQKAAKLLEELK